MLGGALIRESGAESPCRWSSHSDLCKAAVAYYQEHGQNPARTIKKLGYPSRATLFNWLEEDIGRSTHPCRSGSPVVKLQQDQKEQVVIDLCIRESSAEKIASKHGVSRASLYKRNKDAPSVLSPYSQQTVLYVTEKLFL